MKTGVIDVGGGFRGIYAAGVLDRCLEQGISFDLGIGISAGSANLASFAAGQRGRNYRFYTDYSCRRQYAGLGNFLRKRSYVDLDYVYSVLSNHDGEDPLDYPALRDNPMELYVIALDALTGRTKLFSREDVAQDRYDVFKASSALPWFCRPYVIRGVPYYDGGMGDPVPVERALSMGCDRVVVILTKPVEELRTSRRDERIAARIRRDYPMAARRLCRRAELYNREVALARRYAGEGRVLIVAPDDTCGVDTLRRTPDSLERLYEKGREDGLRIAPFLGYGNPGE